MRAYCTLFDRNYLLQGVALYNSLCRWAGDFRLFALCMDDTAYEMLKELAYEQLVPVRVAELLNSEVAMMRERTTHGQFCWVCQPLICQFLLDSTDFEMVTYLEADSLFFSSPEVLFQELGDRSVSLVPHNFSPGLNNTAEAGKYCVQFNAFRDDATGRGVLDYWKQCCFRYDKARPRYYPGQICLDEWPARFAGVATLTNPGAGVAPWNAGRYALDELGGIPTVDGVPAVFFHYHQYGRRRNGDHELGSYPMSTAVIDRFYRPYVRELETAKLVVRKADPSFTYRREYSNVLTLGELLHAPTLGGISEYLDAAKRRLRGRYNVYPDGYFSELAEPVFNG